MAKLNEEARDYEPPQTKNIADLEVVFTDLDVKEASGTNNKGEDFTYKYIVVKDVEYRVPGVVLGQLKTHLEEKPDLKTFKVKKEGEGIKSKYTVVPLK